LGYIFVVGNLAVVYGVCTKMTHDPKETAHKFSVGRKWPAGYICFQTAGSESHNVSYGKHMYITMYIQNVSTFKVIQGHWYIPLHNVHTERSDIEGHPRSLIYHYTT